MPDKGKGKIVAEEEQEAGGGNRPSFFLGDDDDDYFEDTFDETSSSNFMVGWRFQPTDQELLGFFLRRKTRNTLPHSHDFIPLVQLYVPGAEPWCVHPGMAAAASSSSSSAAHNAALPRKTTEWSFCFSYTTPRGPGSSRTAGSGSWVCNGREVVIRGSRNQIIGYSNTFSFKTTLDGGKRGVSTNWVMHEYRLHGDKATTQTRGSRRPVVSDTTQKEELVLCRIRCTKAVRAPADSSTQGELLLTDEGGSFGATGKKRRRTTTAALIPDIVGPEDVEFSAPSVPPLPPSAGPPSTASVDDSALEYFDWQGWERFMAGEASGGLEKDASPANIPSPEFLYPVLAEQIFGLHFYEFSVINGRRVNLNLVVTWTWMGYG